MINGMIIDRNDNVGVAIYTIKKGDSISYVAQNQKVIEITALEDIQIYHKFAVCNIAMNEPIIKYGEHIGRAAVDIKKGQHVHVHNVKSVRENLG